MTPIWILDKAGSFSKIEYSSASHVVGLNKVSLGFDPLISPKFDLLNPQYVLWTFVIIHTTTCLLSPASLFGLSPFKFVKCFSSKKGTRCCILFAPSHSGQVVVFVTLWLRVVLNHAYWSNELGELRYMKLVNLMSLLWLPQCLIMVSLGITQISKLTQAPLKITRLYWIAFTY